MPRDFATDAALRPQPKREGPDHWATPDCLTAALVTHILPDLPPAPVWEPAAGMASWSGQSRRPAIASLPATSLPATIF